jgi:hypothetical protein
MGFAKKARLLDDLSRIDQYRPILEKDNFKTGESHWNSVGKNVITLFQVLIDQDLTHLVMVLEAYPQYVELVCEHFRYAYSYSENEANVEAASELLKMGEPFFTKQFVRNVVRKLPRIDSYTLDEIGGFVPKLAQASRVWHPIITKHYHSAVMQRIDQMRLHPLQRIALIRMIEKVQLAGTFDYDAEDRDATLDIPYMH